MKNSDGIVQRFVIAISFALIIGLIILVTSTSTNNKSTEKSWDQVLQNISEGNCSSVVMTPEKLFVVIEKKDVNNKISRQTISCIYPGGALSDSNKLNIDEAINQSLKKNKQISVRGSLDRKIEWMPILTAMICSFIGLIILLHLFGVGKKNPLDISKAGKFISPEDITVRFRDVAGIDESKMEVEEIVIWFKHNIRYRALNARPPRGILLHGPPGTGKTMLAKAMAGESGAYFISLSGSDFVEMLVGVGASRVRDLFKRARSLDGPCVIFIDEIDAIGRSRSNNMNSNTEVENTLNAILCEMDGMTPNEHIIVLAATNRLELLDKALIRPGRFDRHVAIQLPDIAGRKAILATHSKKYVFTDDVDLEMIAKQTSGFSGASLATMLNESAWFAARNQNKRITWSDIIQARDRIAYGAENRSRCLAMSENDKKNIAIHETGHVVIQKIIKNASIDKVTIIPRGQSLGAMISFQERDKYNYTKRDLINEICVLLGGRAAEDLWSGDISTGASSDLEKASEIADKIVNQFGMVDGKLYIKNDKENHDKSCELILQDCYKIVKECLIENKDVAQMLINTLVEKETILGEEIDRIIYRHQDTKVSIAASLASEEVAVNG